jgi:hypothetical protein
LELCARDGDGKGFEVFDNEDFKDEIKPEYVPGKVATRWLPGRLFVTTRTTSLAMLRTIHYRQRPVREHFDMLP